MLVAKSRTKFANQCTKDLRFHALILAPWFLYTTGESQGSLGQAIDRDSSTPVLNSRACAIGYQYNSGWVPIGRKGQQQAVKTIVSDMTYYLRLVANNTTSGNVASEARV